MKVLRREWFNVTRGDEWRLFPLGDIHLGNVACDEKLFRSVVERIAADDKALWIGLGDYCDFINVSDPRFSVASLAKWIQMADLADLARAQRDKFLEIVKPIASKCVGLVEGNHERSIQRHYERDIYSEIVMGVKDAGSFDVSTKLGLGYSGWLLLNFYRADEKKRATNLRLYLHHGFVGGRLAGAKALNMQRALHTRDADLVIMGHSHNESVQVEAVESVRGSHVVLNHRIGVFSGTFLAQADYAEVKGYLPLPVTQPVVLLKPGACEIRDRIRVVV